MEPETIQKKNGTARFTPLNAKEFAARSLAARRRNKAERLLRLKRRPKPEWEKKQSLEPEPLAQATEAKSGEVFCRHRLARIRRQLAMLDTLFENEDNPQKLDRLASAQHRLSEQERILSGRPLPGSQRPRLAKPAKASGTSVEPE